MIKKYTNILSILRYISFVCVFYSLAMQPIISSINLVDELSSEIIELDVEDSSNSDENQESEEEEEVKKNNFFTTHFDIINSAEKILIFYKLNLLQDISFDIHIPPPESI